MIQHFASACVGDEYLFKFGPQCAIITTFAVQQFLAEVGGYGDEPLKELTKPAEVLVQHMLGSQ
jgi:hypothetical protein